ncbi:MAG: hypothetical protein ACRDMX_00435 [Solirubrobacteraceae bacterium]
MTETAPRTSERQPLRALEKANEIRTERAKLRRGIAVGAVSAADVILHPPVAAASWPIGDLLMSQRRWGTTRCRRFLSVNQIAELRTVGQLTERQRQMLAGSLQTSARSAPELISA